MAASRRTRSAPAASYPAVPLSDARARLSPLLDGIERTGPLAISVRGAVRGYLVGPREFEEMRRLTRGPAASASISGSLEITGDLEKGSRDAALELLRSAGGAGASLRRRR